MSKVPPVAVPAPAKAEPGKAKKPDPPEKKLGGDFESPGHSRGISFAAEPPPDQRGSVTGFLRVTTVQAKARVNRRGDKYEDEADRVADMVVDTPPVPRKRPGISYSILPATPPVQAKGNVDGREIDDNTNALIQSSRGTALSDGDREYFESRMGQDFSSVRVHTGSSAQSAARNIQARAFTTGSDVYFGEGQFQPGTREGKKLIAHELTHVVQQGGAGPRSPTDGQGVARAKPIVKGRLAKKRIQREGFSFGLTGGVLKQVDRLANNIPGYRLLKFALGFSPITGKKVPRTAVNLIGALLATVPGGNLLLERLKRVRAVEKAFAWVTSNLKQHRLTIQRAKNLFKTVKDGLLTAFTPGRIFKLFKETFLPLFRDVKRFTKAAAWKIKELVFNGFMKLVGGTRGPIGRLIARARPVIRKIWNDPVAFANNVMRGVKLGVKGFLKRIGTHLKKGFMEWLFGSVGRAGIIFPDQLSFKGIASIVMQVAGLTYANFRVRAVKKFGEKVVAVAEKGMAIFTVLRERGPLGIWEHIQDKIQGITRQAIAAVRNLIIVQAIKAGILWILSLLNPASAIVKVLKALVDVAFFVIQRAKQLVEFGKALLDSVIAIANGNVSAIARKVEFAFSRAIPVAIGLLASLAGFGSIATKITGKFQLFQKPTNLVIDKVLEKFKKAIRRLVRKAKKGAKKVIAGVVQWWRSKVRFNSMDGKSHTLFFKGRGRKAELMVASRQRRVSRSLQERRQELTNSEMSAEDRRTGERDITEAERENSAVERTTRSLVRANRARGKNRTLKQRLLRRLTGLLNGLGKLFGRIFGRGKDVKVEMPEPKFSHGTDSVAVKDLSPRRPGPSGRPRSDPKGWKIINDGGISTSDPKTLLGDQWVKMHLISDKLAGPDQPWNLVPAPNSINSGKVRTREEIWQKLVSPGRRRKLDIHVTIKRWQKKGQPFLSPFEKGKVLKPSGKPYAHFIKWQVKQYRLKRGAKDASKESSWHKKQGKELNVEVPFPPFQEIDKLVRSVSNKKAQSLKAIEVGELLILIMRFGNSQVSLQDAKRDLTKAKMSDIRKGVFQNLRSETRRALNHLKRIKKIKA